MPSAMAMTPTSHRELGDLLLAGGLLHAQTPARRSLSICGAIARASPESLKLIRRHSHCVRRAPWRRHRRRAASWEGDQGEGGQRQGSSPRQRNGQAHQRSARQQKCAANRPGWRHDHSKKGRLRRFEWATWASAWRKVQESVGRAFRRPWPAAYGHAQGGTYGDVLFTLVNVALVRARPGSRA